MGKATRRKLSGLRGVQDLSGQAEFAGSSASGVEERIANSPMVSEKSLAGTRRRLGFATRGGLDLSFFYAEKNL